MTEWTMTRHFQYTNADHVTLVSASSALLADGEAVEIIQHDLDNIGLIVSKEDHLIETYGLWKNSRYQLDLDTLHTRGGNESQFIMRLKKHERYENYSGDHYI